jgi:hypothetical protein
MTLHIQFLDPAGRPLPKAVVTLTFATKDGKAWSPDPLVTDADGGAILDTIPDAVIANLAPSQSSFFVAHEGRESGPHPLSRPQPWKDGARALRLTVPDISAEPEDKPEPPRRKEMQVTFRLGLGPRQPLKGAAFQLRLLSYEGQTLFGQEGELDARGETHFTLAAKAFEQVNWSATQLGVTQPDGTMLTPNGPPRPQTEDDGVLMIWTMAQAGGNTDAGDPPKPPRPSDPESPAHEKGERQVSGRVMDSDGSGLGNLTVEAFDVEIGAEKSLGKQTSRRDGTYQITYTRDQLLDPDKRAADLLLRVHAANGAVLAESPLIARAAKQQIVDFSVGEGEDKGPSLFLILSRKILPELKGKPPRSMRAQDAELLTSRTGLSRNALAEFFVSWRMADEVRLPDDEDVAASFYGWIHGGLSTNRDELLALSDAELRRAHLQAQNENWIAAANARAVIAKIRENAPDLADDLTQDFYLLLELAGIDKSKGPDILRVLSSDDERDKKWEEIETIAGRAKSIALREIIEIWKMLDRNVLLTRGMISAHSLETAIGLSRVSEQDLADQIKGAEVDLSEVEGATEATRVKIYAADLARAIEAQFAYETFLHQLARLQPARLVDVIGKLLSARDIRFDQRPDAPEDDSIANLRSLYLVGPEFRRAGTVFTLSNQGFDSAAGIVKTGRPAFIRAVEKDLGKPAAAEIFDRARALAAIMDAAQSRDLTTRPLGDATEPANPDTLLGQLFQGSLSTACTHCASVLGPSAYLVDLYNYIGLARLDNKSGQDMLNARRPDIARLHTSCDNSDTLLPYIDLVLEIFEDTIAPPNSGQDRDYPQTTHDSDVLLAKPTHVNRAAYDVLKQAEFPWRLPFDRDFTRTRQFIEHAGVRLSDIRRSDYTNDDQVAANAALVGLSNPSALVTDGRVSAIARGYGRANLGSLRQISSFQSLARHLLLGQEELLALISTGFVGADKSILLDADLSINWSVLSNGHLDRLLLIGRLWRQTGRELSELDVILKIIGLPTNSTLPQWLADFAAGVRLPKRLMADLATLPSIIGGNGLGELSDLTGHDEHMLAWLAQVGQLGLDRLVGVDQLLDHMGILTTGGLTLEDARDMLHSAPETGRFSLAEADRLLSELTSELSQMASQDNTGDAETTRADATHSLAAASILSNGFGCMLETIQSLIEADGAHLLKGAFASAGLVPSDPAAPSVALTPTDIVRLWKECRLIEAIGLGASEVMALRQIADNLGVIDPSKLPVETEAASIGFNALLLLLQYQNVNLRVFADTESGLFARLAAIHDGAAIVKTLDVPRRWRADFIGNFLGPQKLNVTTAAQLFNQRAVLTLHRLLEQASQLKLDPDSLWKLRVENDGDLAEATVLSHYDGAKGLGVLTELNAPMRSAMRDALLEHIIHASRIGGGAPFGTVADVYDHFLIDPEMSPCFKTSRTVQACASIQQFVMRIQLGLEGNLAFEEEHALEWPWRRNYRVWEANRKVFIFPENWIEPELRDNKTELYQALEDTLEQSDLTNEIAERALLEYARGLHRLSRLEMMGLLDDPQTRVTHVFARTRDLPHSYFWCKRTPNGLWSGWESLGLEIEGDHVLPAVYAGRVFLFWCHFAEKLDSENTHYQRKLARLQRDEDAYRSQLNSLQRKIDDATQLAAENRKKASEHTWQFNIDLYNHIAKIYEDAAKQAETDYENASAALEQTKVDIAALKLDYSFLEIHLSWSQWHPTLGWTALKRSTGSIETRRGGGAAKGTYFRDRNKISMRQQISGGRLSIWLSACDEAPAWRSHLFKTIDLGHFHYDIASDAMDVQGFTNSSIPYDLPQLVANGRRSAQKHLLRLPPGFQGLQIFEDAGVSVALLPNLRNQEASIVPATRAYADFGNTPFLFNWGDKSYFSAPTGAALKKSKPGLSMEPPLQSPRQISPSQWLELAHPAADLALMSPFSPNAGKVAGLSIGSETSSLSGAIKVNALQPSVAKSKAERSFASAITTATGAQGKAGSVSNSVVTLAGPRKWRFTQFYHPLTEPIVTALFRHGLSGLYAPDLMSGDPDASVLERQALRKNYFQGRYNPTASVAQPYPLESFTFDRTEPYAIYNWELFFHTPFAIAKQLTRNRKYSEAQTWLHYIFNPVSKDRRNTAFAWRFGPFHDEHTRILDGKTSNLADMSEADLAQFNAQVEEWQRNPFNPHAVARLRSLAYMRATFMAYLDNLIAWGDDLFTRDTMESINEATQLYVFAAQLLGQRPLDLPEGVLGRVPRSVEQVLAGEVTSVYVDDAPFAADPTRPHGPATGFFSIFSSMCMPSNDKLTGYWDTLSDRLFKIRHCMNIDGVVRQLPLFQPPIDPALLVRAAAAGISVSDALAGMVVPRPHYRFSFMIRKALDFTSDVKALGGAVLAALEKKDAEEISRLRARHEVTMSRRMLEIRKSRIEEARAQLDSVQTALHAAFDRQKHYQRLLDQDLLPQEVKEQKKQKTAHGWSQTAAGIRAISSTLSAFPTLGTVGFQPATKWGGLHLGQAVGAKADVANMVASQHSFEAGMQGREAGFIRRRQDWAFQKQTADREIMRLEKDQIAAEIRLAMAEKELDDQTRQIAHAEEAQTFLEGKFTNAQLYGWMSNALASLHYQAYQLAHDLAKQAEACMRFELEKPDASYITFGHWDSMRRGLLAGERLTLDLRRLEAAYLTEHKRDLELTKNVSLVRLNPSQLLQLQSTGTCAFEVPEFLFDIDHPGHYQRRIKSVSLTIPAVAGPQTSIGATLTLENSMVRVRPVDNDDAIEYRSTHQSISTSSGQNDAGLFQLDFRDERYLPFEGMGAVSQWRLKLPPPSLAQFDYRTISDVIMHIRYSSKRDEGFEATVVENCEDALTELTSSFDAQATPLARLFSLRFDFPSAWAHLQASTRASPLTLDLSKERFPYLFSGRNIRLLDLEYSTGTVTETQDLDQEVGVISLTIPEEIAEGVRGGADDVSIVAHYSVL